jgi:hypothetical protein
MSDGNPNASRRQFLTKAGLSLCLIAPLTLNLKALAEAGKLVLVPETDPQAVALGYKTDASKVDTKKWPKRAGADGAKQFCYNCSLYQYTGTDPKGSGSAICQIFAGRAVQGKGWCNTWVQNPKVGV